MVKIFILLFFAALMSLSHYSWAANYSNPIEGVFKGIYGDTIVIEVPSQVSKSPQTDETENGDLTFQLISDTGYRNFQQLTDLKKGDYVKVEYKEDPNGKSKKMSATTITKLDSQTVSTTTVGPEVVSAPVVQQTVTTTTTTVKN